MLTSISNPATYPAVYYFLPRHMSIECMITMQRNYIADRESTQIAEWV